MSKSVYKFLGKCDNLKGNSGCIDVLQWCTPHVPASAHCLHVSFSRLCVPISSPADDGVEDLTSLFYHVFDFIEVDS